MDNAYTKLIQSLKKSGLSVTQPRKVVFEALYSFGLQSMNQLISRCTSCDRASVYRAVDVLEGIGVIQRVRHGFKYKLELSDSFLPHHHHIVCTLCGKAADIEQSRLESLLEDIAVSEQFVLVSHKVELNGICIDCRK